jgi:hypothetical protein
VANLKKIRIISGLIKKIQVLFYDFNIFWDFSKLFFIEKVMNRVYGLRDHDRLLVHDGLVEREEVVRVPTNDTTWRQSCVDGDMTALNGGS